MILNHQNVRKTFSLRPLRVSVVPVVPVPRQAPRSARTPRLPDAKVKAEGGGTSSAPGREMEGSGARSVRESPGSDDDGSIETGRSDQVIRMFMS